MAEEGQQAADISADDISSAQAFIQREIATALEGYGVTRPQGATSTAHPLQSVIDPLVSPAINSARVIGLAAQDEARFYRRHPDSAAYEEKIEKLFQQGVESGRLIDRESIFNYLVGQEVNTNPDKYVEALAAKKAAQLSDARRASDFGAGGSGRDLALEKFDGFESKTLEEMEALLKDIPI